MVVESQISEVTVYARGARVRRVMTIALAPGAARVRIADLPAAVIDDTVRIEATGDALVSALHVGLDAPPSEAAAGEEAPEVRGARERVARAAAEVERLDAALAILAAAPIALPLPERDAAPPAWRAVVAARQALVGLRAERELALRDQVAAARREADAAQRALAAVVDRDRRAGSARGARLHELRKHVELDIAGSGAVTLALEYQVAAARWAPSYVARIDGDAVAFELRAVVAQDTGEDWTGVALRLSTAEPERFGALPELSAQRIGRRQRDPVRAGFRAPPVGAGELYLDYARAFAPTPPPVSAPPAPRDGRGSATAGYAPPPPPMAPSPPSPVQSAPPPYPMPPPGAPPPPSFAAAPSPARASAPAPQAFVGSLDGAPRAKSGGVVRIAAGIASSFGGGGGAREPDADVPPPPPAPPPPRLDYANLRMAPAGSPQRGTLIPAPRDRRLAALDGEVATAAARVDALVLPRGCSAQWSHAYDYAFATDGQVDVVADGAWHSIAVTARASTAKVRHVAVPREQPDVFRLAELVNPLAGPLLPGPIDVYDRGRFLVTSEVEHTPSGATVEIGLGVDAAVKLARNTEFSEEATGMLRGGLRLHHVITIDIDNLSDRAIELEVRERLPVTREGDDEVEVIAGKIEPAWERWTPDPDAPRDQRLRGGYRWRVAIAPHAKRALRAAYDVKLAGKLELVGGNRRES